MKGFMLAAAILLAASVSVAVSLPAHAQDNPPAAKTPSPARTAHLARLHACAAEWKADKPAGKVPAGMKWPKYWSDCNKRKKAEGM